MRKTNEAYYPELSDRLNMKKPFTSLTRLTKTDLIAFTKWYCAIPAANNRGDRPLMRPSRRSSWNWRPTSSTTRRLSCEKFGLLQSQHPARVGPGLRIYKRDTTSEWQS